MSTPTFFGADVSITEVSIPEAIAETLSSNQFEELTPRAINSGLCHAFAESVLKRTTDPSACLAGDPRIQAPHPHLRTETDESMVVQSEWEGCGHIWVFDGNRHYDAQWPEGVKEWCLLF